MTLRTPAARPRLTAPALSLLTALGAANLNPEPADWRHGIVLGTQECGNIGGLAVDRTAIGCPTASVPFIDHGRTPLRNVDPVVLVSSASCSTGGGNFVAEVEQRARDILDAMTPFGVEHELWTGALAQAAHLGEPSTALPRPAAGNRWLASPEAVTLTTGTTGVSPLATVGLLEEALGQFPGQSMIHAGLRAAAFLGFAATRTGARLETKLGTIIVPGSGYGTTGPDGLAAPAGTAWVYGTGQVTVRLGPSELTAEGAPNVDRSTNTATAYATRDVLVDFDGCAHFAALMTLKND